MFCVLSLLHIQQQDLCGERNRPKYNGNVCDCMAENTDKGNLIHICTVIGFEKCPWYAQT